MNELASAGRGCGDERGGGWVRDIAYTKGDYIIVKYLKLRKHIYIYIYVYI